MPPARLPSRPALSHAFIGAMPAVFVVIWSTGFVVARLAMPHAPPMTFLALRFALSLACLLVWVTLARARWPQPPLQWLHLAVVGVLMQVGYLGGVWSAVKAGLGAGTAALLVGLQPCLTALWMSLRAPANGLSPSRVSVRQWLGLALGLGGLTLVVWHKLGGGEVTARNLTLALLALLGITIGTLYQKRFVAACDVRTAGAVQMLAALVVSLPFAWAEPETVRWSAAVIGALAWSVLVLTLGGSSLLYLLIQRGAATQVSSLMYLVPPCTAVLAWVLFGEAFTVFMLAGLVLTATGVALVVRGR
jgi:drug/metabolite transporter (DMT)-like permease